MPLHLIQNDITAIPADAIVNAANSSLLGGGGVDGCIHRAAGHGLLEECRTLGGCATGDAKITRGYNLPCKYVIHAVGPCWKGGGFHEKELLESCYRRALELAVAHQCETVAFPLISAGIYGYPKAQALRVATETIGRFLEQTEMTVYLVIYDKASYQIEESLRSTLAAYVQQPPLTVVAECNCLSPYDALQEKLRQTDESFSQALLRLIDEKGYTDAECYKKANIDRKLFSKIRSNPSYRPKKTTALAFAIALELSLEETEDLLRKAGFALSPSSRFDLIIEYFILHQNYNVLEINEALFAFDQALLGG